ncbi:hypothetical protein B0H10DRAFT_2225146 [Mycena sp. CBHHK59/15]|nr:hypothetical protein B0H10DRAFT_2225146 [Mycena sp. CBHHK59/15]
MTHFPLTDHNDNLSGGHASPPARSDSEPERPQEHRKRARSSSPSPRRLSLKTGRADKRPRAVVEELPKAKFVAGKAPGSSRTNIKDYAEPAAKLLKATMHQYEVRIWMIDPFPKSELQTQWVKEIWEDALKANQKLWKALLADSSFHYEDTAELMGYAGNPIIIESIRVLWFKTKAGRGIIYLQFFSPIALVTLALIFTAIEFCIEEYSTGRFQQGTFDEAFNKDRYETHLKDLTDWAALMPAITDKIRQKMHGQTSLLHRTMLKTYST